MRVVKCLWFLAFTSITAASFLDSDNIKTGLIHALVAIGIISVVTIVSVPLYLGIKNDLDRGLL